MHFTFLAGAVLWFFIRESWSPLVVLVIFKILWDLDSHAHERKRLAGEANMGKKAEELWEKG